MRALQRLTRLRDHWLPLASGWPRWYLEAVVRIYMHPIDVEEVSREVEGIL